MNPVIHIRHKRTKHSSNSQFYKSDKFDGKLETLCGDAMTDKDLPIKSCLNRHFSPIRHESTFNVTICHKCLSYLPALTDGFTSV